MNTFELTRHEFEALEYVNENFIDHDDLKLVKVEDLKYGNGLYTGYSKDSEEFLDGYDYLVILIADEIFNCMGIVFKDAWESKKISDMHYYLILNLAEKFDVPLSE